MPMNDKLCRSCRHRELLPVLSLGSTPLANALRTKAQLSQPEEMFPLSLALCPACALLQILETVPPEKLFAKYFYFSSNSDTMLRSARRLVEQTIVRRDLGR